MRENRAGSCVKMEAHSSERAEGGGEDNDLSSLLDTTLRSLIHRHLCTLDVSFVRATAAGGGGGGWGQVLAAATLVRVQRSRCKCAELRGCGLAARLMMLFAFPSFAEDGSGVSTRGLLFVLTHRGARGGGTGPRQQMWGGLRQPR